jgi:lipopolysaccharide transport system permease protein
MGELWRYRDTLYFLARRDIAVRYKQTVVGLVWVILQPIAFALVLHVLPQPTSARSHRRRARNGVFALTGMTVWLFFSMGLTRVSDSTVSGSALISKIWFPRLSHPAISYRTGSHRSRGVDPSVLWWRC